MSVVPLKSSQCDSYRHEKVSTCDYDTNGCGVFKADAFKDCRRTMVKIRWLIFFWNSIYRI